MRRTRQRLGVARAELDRLREALESRDGEITKLRDDLYLARKGGQEARNRLEVAERQRPADFYQQLKEIRGNIADERTAHAARQLDLTMAQMAIERVRRELARHGPIVGTAVIRRALDELDDPPNDPTACHGCGVPYARCRAEGAVCCLNCNHRSEMMDDQNTSEQTTKRVFVGLTIAIDVDPGIILAEVNRTLRPELVRQIVGTSAQAFDLADEDTEPSAYIVLTPAGVVWATYLDEGEADKRASEIHGVLLEVPIVKDYRLPVADGT